ncbi:HNH endonuclease (plasmid) [Deinococcus sp. VB343]|uniref:HNH endonuclease n=1 Tax=Deinococcus sp. VB343 TaxID=3385567 RepID=UPI0039C8C3F1
MTNGKGSHLDVHFLQPSETPDPSLPDREAWLNQQSEDFVGTPTNTEYYRVFLEVLWPQGHGIPGPTVTQDQLRGAVNAYRNRKYQEAKAAWEAAGKRGKEPKEPAPYLDPFRRLRELQGEEGFLGLKKEGNRAQLQNLEVSPKRTPRIKLASDDWKVVLDKYGGRCANCRRKPPEVTFDQDHKVPRVRGGGNEIENWQPLCTECNNFKSTACRGCELDCQKCPWAFPEKYTPPRVETHLWEAVQELAKAQDVSPNYLLNLLVERGLEQL